VGSSSVPTDSPKPPIMGLLLAGGLSRRMGGGDKTLRTLGGQPMLAHVIARLRPQVGAMVLNANGDPARFVAFGLPVVADTIPDYAGPLAGILTGLRWAQSNQPDVRWIASAAADTPFFPHDLVARLHAAVQSSASPAKPKIVLAASADGLQPVFGLWPVALADDLERALAAGTRKILAWTDTHDTAVVTFAAQMIRDRAIDPFFNANRPEDLAVAEKLLELERS
jgi:molybdenum cofactor guanylyltransferase